MILLKTKDWGNRGLTSYGYTPLGWSIGGPLPLGDVTLPRRHPVSGLARGRTGRRGRTHGVPLPLTTSDPHTFSTTLRTDTYPKSRHEEKWISSTLGIQPRCESGYSGASIVGSYSGGYGSSTDCWVEPYRSSGNSSVRPPGPEEPSFIPPRP